MFLEDVQRGSSSAVILNRGPVAENGESLSFSSQQLRWECGQESQGWYRQLLRVPQSHEATRPSLSFVHSVDRRSRPRDRASQQSERSGMRLTICGHPESLSEVVPVIPPSPVSAPLPHKTHPSALAQTSAPPTVASHLLQVRRLSPLPPPRLRPPPAVRPPGCSCDAPIVAYRPSPSDPSEPAILSI